MKEAPYPRLMPSERLLLALCRANPGEASRIPALGSLDPDTLLDELSALSIRHSVQGLIFSRLASSPELTGLFPGREDWIRKTLSLLTRQATVRDLEQDRVMAGLRRAGYEPLVLKGGALRKWVFTTPVQRAMGDLDILVPHEELPGVLGALETLGYAAKYPEAVGAAFRAHLYHDRVMHPNGFEVEVHWGLTRPGAFVQLDPKGFLDRSRILQTPQGRGLRVPSPEDMVLHTVSQSEQDGIRSLRRLVDLDRMGIAETLDWDHLIGQATETRLLPALCVTYRLANVTLGTPAPAELLRGAPLSRTPRNAIAAMMPVRRLLGKPQRGRFTDEYLFRLWCLPQGRQRWRWIGALASGAGDPLAWVWEAYTREKKGGGWSRKQGVLFVIKLIVYQAGVLLSALLAPFQTGGRARLRFWAG